MLRSFHFRGSNELPFKNLVFLPFTVRWDSNDDDSPKRTEERAIEEIVQRTLKQRPS
jgi:hypothetical protein